MLTALAAVPLHPQARPALRSIGVPTETLLVELGHVATKLLAAYAARRGKHRWVDKTPNYYTVLDHIDVMLGGQSQYLFMVRHPFDSIASLEEFFGSPSESHPDPEISRVARRYGYGRLAWMKYWLEANERIAFAIESFGPRALLVRYEDLVMSPGSAIARVFEFLGESQQPDVVSRALVASHDEGFQDYKIKHSRTVHTESLHRGWRSLNAGERATVWGFVEGLAESFGYTAEAQYEQWVGLG